MSSHRSISSVFVLFFQLLIALSALFLCHLTWAYAPKPGAVVSIDVTPTAAMDAGVAADSATSTSLDLQVDIHSRLSLAQVTLRLDLDSRLQLIEGQATWQGTLAAGQTLRLRYRFLASAEQSLPSAVELARFSLFRIENTQPQWLTSAGYALPTISPATTPARLPRNGNLAAERQASGAASAYVIDYSLD